MLPAPPAQGRRLPWVWWLLAAALVVLGLWLIPAALAARRRVSLRWGFTEHDPSRQVTIELPTGEPRLLSAAAQPSPDPFCVWADNAQNEVQRRAVLQGLGSLTADADGLVVTTSDLYLLRPAGEAAWANQARTRRGDTPLYLEFRLVSETWPLTRRPIGLEALPHGRDWQQRLVIGILAVVLGLIILLVARPTQPVASVPLPGPSTSSDTPTELLCGSG